MYCTDQQLILTALHCGGLNNYLISPHFSCLGIDLVVVPLQEDENCTVIEYTTCSHIKDRNCSFVTEPSKMSSVITPSVVNAGRME